MTQDEFERQHAKNSDVTLEWWRSHFIGLPCGCDDETCEGWAAVRRDPFSIDQHLDFYAPDAPRRGALRFANMDH